MLRVTSMSVAELELCITVPSVHGYFLQLTDHSQGKGTNHQCLASSIKLPWASGGLWVCLEGPVYPQQPTDAPQAIRATSLQPAICLTNGNGHERCEAMVITASRNHKWICKDDIGNISPGMAASREVTGRRLRRGPEDRRQIHLCLTLPSLSPARLVITMPGFTNPLPKPHQPPVSCVSAKITDAFHRNIIA